MPSVPILGEREGLSRKEALELVRNLKADGYRAFYESYPGNKKKRLYRVMWY